MRRALATLRRLGRQDDGYISLVELTVAAGLAMLVLGTSAMVLTRTQRAEGPIDTRGAAIQHARTGIEQITREVRQGWSATSATSSSVVLLTYVHKAVCGGTTPSTTAIPCRVSYNCSGGACTRTESQTNGTGPGSPVRIVSGLSSNAVFTYQPDTTLPRWIGVTLAFPGAHGANAITVADGATLRNPIPPTTPL